MLNHFLHDMGGTTTTLPCGLKYAARKPSMAMYLVVLCCSIIKWVARFHICLIFGVSR
jgi:hypothetical protein